MENKSLKKSAGLKKAKKFKSVLKKASQEQVPGPSNTAGDVETLTVGELTVPMAAPLYLYWSPGSHMIFAYQFSLCSITFSFADNYSHHNRIDVLPTAFRSPILRKFVL